jgi:hypothetical protein
MSRWTFEPGHTAAEFSARHMMVTHVRGHFKDVHGTLNFDPKNTLGAPSSKSSSMRAKSRPASRPATLTYVAQPFSTWKIFLR